jgi:serine/threonine-protein kinase
MARDRMIALKLLPERLIDDPSFVARFRREARLAARVSDPHLVPVHDFGEIEGRLYIAMALIDGDDLGSVLEHGGPLAPADAVGILEQVAAALDAVHAAGLVHRDVKPSNVLLTAPRPGRRRFAYLADFGIVRPIVTSTGSDLTGSQVTVGTLQYMAPERFLSGNVDHLADVYALACVLYECLTGRRAFPGEDIPALIAAHLNWPVPRPSGVRPELAAFDPVVAVGMAKEPGQRYGSAGELMAAAERAFAGSPPPAAPGPTFARRADPVAASIDERAAPTTTVPASAIGFEAPATVTATPPTAVSTAPRPTPVSPPSTGQPRRRWSVVAGIAAALIVVVMLAAAPQILNGPDEPTSPPATDSPAPTTTMPPTTAFGSSTVGKTIPDDPSSGLVDSITLSGSGMVGRLQMRVAVNDWHTADLEIYLISPSGRIELIRDNVYFEPNGRTFDSDDGIAIANFVGEPYDGRWTIEVVDTVARDQLVLDSWSIEVTTA